MASLHCASFSPSILSQKQYFKKFKILNLFYITEILVNI